jgi:ammonia channel protein AmtB
MFTWASVCSILFFLLMKKLNLLRIEKEIEIIGLDVAELGGLSDDVYQKIKIEYGRNLALN